MVGTSALLAAGPDRLAAASAPLAEAVQAAGAGAIAPVVRVGGVLACLGALLALIGGVSRTGLAMARNRTGQQPGPAALAGGRAPAPPGPAPRRPRSGRVITLLVLTADLRDVIG